MGIPILPGLAGRRPKASGRAKRYKLPRVSRVSPVVAGLGAIVFAFWFVSELQLIVPFFTLVGEGSGGIGAVSIGIGGELMRFAAAGVANRSIARWARRSGGIARRMHILHSVALVTVPLLLVLWIAGALLGVLSSDGRVVAAIVFSVGALFTAQLGLLSILLGLFTWRRTRPAPASG
jgi:hypothetical protein